MVDTHRRVEPRVPLLNTGVNCDHDHIEELKKLWALNERSNRKKKTIFKRVIRDQVEAKILEEKRRRMEDREPKGSDATD